MKTWSCHSRYSYNKAIGLINEHEHESDIIYSQNVEEVASRKIYYSKLELRNLITPADVNCRIPWILETPKHIRESAVFEAHKNFQSALSNLRNGHIRCFKLGFQRKRDTNWTIGIPKSAITVYNNSIGIYESRTTYARFKTVEKVKEINHDCNLHFDGLNYYICIPYEKELRTNKTSNWFCSMDPGVRKFQTIYSPDEDHHIVIGNRSSKRMYGYLLKLDKLISQKGDMNKIKKLRIRISNLQRELHYKSANFICNMYENIYIPKLTKNNDIINKDKRRLRTETVRKMVVLGHCKFIERLKTKAKEFTNVQVYEISESYSSQRCLHCGMLTKMKRGEEIYKCNTCNLKIDRDVLGSTNILLQNW